MGDRIAIYYGDKRNNGEYDNGVWMDILSIPFIRDVEQAKDFDIVIRTLWVDAIGWSQEIRRRFPHVIQIGLSDHPLSTHISKLQPDVQAAYLKDLEFLDAIMALTEEEKQWYKLAAPSKLVIKGGLPFPFETYEERYGQWRNSEKKFIGLGVGASDNDRNFISSFLVFRKLKYTHPNLQGVYLSLPSYQVSPTAVYADMGKDIFLHERNGMDEFYDILSQCMLVINLADRNTPGRLQGEAAFFGVPVIGSNRLELQNELFPDLAVTPYEVEKAANLASYLLDYPEHADQIGAKAYEKLKKYNYRASKQKFNALVKQIKEMGV